LSGIFHFTAWTFKVEKVRVRTIEDSSFVHPKLEKLTPEICANRPTFPPTCELSKAESHDLKKNPQDKSSSDNVFHAILLVTDQRSRDPENCRPK
jgi:hypothetical protein